MGVENGQTGQDPTHSSAAPELLSYRLHTRWLSAEWRLPKRMADTQYGDRCWLWFQAAFYLQLHWVPHSFYLVPRPKNELQSSTVLQNSMSHAVVDWSPCRDWPGFLQEMLTEAFTLLSTIKQENHQKAEGMRLPFSWEARFIICLPWSHTRHQEPKVRVCYFWASS